ncbi:MAG: hypothetical protein U5S82_24130 [Gammaproteobacteria bacterium]|nr:hypothetical protein [Gammaproteobacteria bacterium]
MSHSEEPLSTRDRRSIAFHAIVRDRLLAEPDAVLGKARSNLVRWGSRYRDPPPCMKAWDAILQQDLENIVAVLEGLDEQSILLRSSSPFAGLVTPAERWRILREEKQP